MKATRCAQGLLLSCSLLLGAAAPVPRSADPLEAAWANPPPSARLTQTNILELTPNTPLIESGLLGPVTLGTINLRE